MGSRTAIGLLVAALAASACSRSSSSPQATPDASGSAVAPLPSATASADPYADTEEDSVLPVYPIDNLPPLPLAARYCDVVRETPKKRSEACCNGFPAFAPTAECTRTLSSALRAGAVTIADADMDACAAAVAKETAGCDWVTSLGSPTPRECLGILKGVIKQGAACRSNLECENGLRCRGLSATHGGRCTPPVAAHAACGIATDSLAVFAGQDDVDRRHPECEGACMARQCRDTRLGQTCVSSVECGAKAYCVAGKCAEALPKGGAACTDACEPGARCSGGKCVVTKADGESCESDVECRGGCARPDGNDGNAGNAGHCGAQCPSFPSPKK